MQEDAIAIEKSRPGEGIWAEKPDYRNTAKHKYTSDNVSYKLNDVFIYDYYYIDKAGIKKKFLVNDRNDSINNPLNTGSYDKPAYNTIDKIMLVVTDVRENYPQCDSTCTQTTIAYYYLTKNALQHKNCGKLIIKEKDQPYFYCEAVSTGVVDNRKNIWIHPPRQHTFKILQLNPFPFYYLDESIDKWAYSVEVGGKYLDPRWISAKENIVLRLNYIRMKDEELSTSFGKLHCKVVNGTGTSVFDNQIFKTRLKSYYHPAYGFVKLEYVNIDRPKMVIQLIKG